jgi:hypothetical protein
VDREEEVTTIEPRITSKPEHASDAPLLTLGLTGVALVLLFVIVPHTVSADGYVRYIKLDTLLRTGALSPDRFSNIGPVFAAPFWLLRNPQSILWWSARFNVLVLAVGCALSWWALRPVLTAADRAAFLLLLVAAGMIPNSVRDFYGELFSTIAVGGGLLIVTVRQQAIGWVGVVLGTANAPASAMGLALVAILRLWKDRRLDAAMALVASVVLIAVENQLSRGSPFNTGYAGDHGYVTMLPYSGMPGFSYPLLLGVVSLLFSFGKGLFFFAPALLLIATARREQPQLARFFDWSIAFLVGLVIVYARWWAWYGGWTWGPRFLLFAAFPSALALALAVRVQGAVARSMAIVIILVWTIWVGVSGAVFDLEGLEACIENRYALEHLCWFVPEFSPLFRHLVLTPSLVPAQQVWMVFAAITAAVLMTSGPSLPRIGQGFMGLVRSTARR